jgi:DNA repair protein SbcD/Mre11
VVSTTKKDSYKSGRVLLEPNRFKTIAIDAVNDPNPEQKILSSLNGQDLTNCVVKVIYSVKPDQLELVNNETIKEKLATTSFCSITPVVVQNPSRTILPELDATYHDAPLKALEKYLDLKPNLNKPALLSKAQLLMEELAHKGR